MNSQNDKYDDMREQMKESALKELEPFAEWYADTFTGDILNNGYCISIEQAMYQWQRLMEESDD